MGRSIIIAIGSNKRIRAGNIQIPITKPGDGASIIIKMAVPFWDSGKLSSFMGSLAKPKVQEY